MALLEKPQNKILEGLIKGEEREHEDNKIVNSKTLLSTENTPISEPKNSQEIERDIRVQLNNDIEIYSTVSLLQILWKNIVVILIIISSFVLLVIGNLTKGT